MSPKTIAPYVLRSLARSQVRGRLCSLEDLSREIGVRKADVRRTVSALHKEGYVDALRMRLTLAGFAIGKVLLAHELPAIPRSKEQACSVAA